MDLPDSQGLRLKEAAAMWPCGLGKMRELMDRGVVKFVQEKPGSPRLTTVGDIRAGRDKLRNQASENEKIEETMEEAFARYESELA